MAGFLGAKREGDMIVFLFVMAMAMVEVTEASKSQLLKKQNVINKIISSVT